MSLVYIELVELPDPHYSLLFVASWWRGLTALLSQCVSSSLIDVGRVSSAYVVFSFLFLPHAVGCCDPQCGDVSAA
eukprot:1138602-Pelagomonas_calceolata.AAC.2